MHWLIAFAAHASAAGSQAAHGLSLPHLAALWPHLRPQHVDEGDSSSLSLPHERVWARALGLTAQDGVTGQAAHAAHLRGLGAPGQAWARVTPTHWAAGTDQVELRGPESLELNAAEETAYFELLAPLFSEAGYAVFQGGAGEWLISQEGLRALPCASIDRVIGRPLETWLKPDVAARAVRRMQSEAQMLLHEHPLNQQREAQGKVTVNSIWISDTGALPTAAQAPLPIVCDGLRLPALRGDWQAWAAAWVALDATVLREALERARAGQPVQLTLCGERHARTHALPAKPSLAQRLLGRWRRADVPALLETL